MDINPSLIGDPDFPYSDRTNWPWILSPCILPSLPAERKLPKISIITPSLNQGKYLEETIRSVLLQNYPNLEYIVMDGGSSDDSLNIIRKYSRWLTHWESAPDNGQSHAINKGVALATGEIIAWINADDIYLPGALHAVAKYFLEKNAKWIVGNTLFADAGLTTTGCFVPRVNTGDWRRKDYKSIGWLDFVMTKWSGTGLPQPSSFWSREDFLSAGGLDETLKYVMDHDLYGRLARQGGVPVLLPQDLAIFRIHDRQKTSDGQAVFFQEELVSLRQWFNADLTEEERITLSAYQHAFEDMILSSRSNTALKRMRQFAEEGVRKAKARLIRYSGNTTIDPRSALMEEIKKYLPEDAVIVEAGAHVGSDTLALARAFSPGQVYAFEPVPRLFFTLSDAVASLPNVRRFPYALGNHNGNVDIYVSSGASDASSSLLPPKEHLKDHPDVFFEEKISAVSITLDDWADLFNIRRVDFLWLDMQGFELEALKHGECVLSAVKAIYTEVNLKEEYQGAALYQELRDWLGARGFTVKLEDLSWEDAGNVLFVREENANG
jgi:FkbM family methyltransferase